ncbi:hypothetical protein D1007_24082 [Hordeum vulgare]|nr:hypothetical protein D1007_24082 [Hordeum vulgare]
MSVAANSATSPLPSAPDVEVDAEQDEEVPRHDDEDEILLPKLVDRVSQHAVEDEYAEEPSSRARFDDTDDEDREENINSLVLQEYDGEDMPTIEWNRENPDLTPGTLFESMVDCRNAVTTYCIVTENSYEVDRSEPGRFTVHFPYDRHCTNQVVASFGEEEQWATANAEEHEAAEENVASLEDNAAVEENATSLENEATEVAIREEEVSLSIREKRHREEETSVEPSSDAEFETMAYEGFEAIREHEVILSEVPSKISEPTDDVNWSSLARSVKAQQNCHHQKGRSEATRQSFQKQKISQPGKPEARQLTHLRTHGARQRFEF